MMSQHQAQNNIEARLRVMRIIWAAMLASVGLYALLGILLRPETAPKDIEKSEALIFLPILFIMSLMAVFVSFAVKKHLFAKAIDSQRPDLVQSAMIVALAMSEAAAIFGLLAIFVTGSLYSFAIMAIGAFGILLHAPKREDLLAASFKINV